jgi:putative flippase GtrA
MILKFIKTHFWKFIIFCFVGGTSALIDLGFFNLFYSLNLNFILSRIIGTIIAVIYNFNMNRNITFSAKGGSLKKHASRYAVIYIIAICANWLTSFLVLGLLGETLLNANIATISGIIIAIPISFLGSLLWAFNEKKPIVVSEII